MRYVTKIVRWVLFLLAIVLFSGCANPFLTSLPDPSSQAVSFGSAYPAVVEVLLPGGRGLCSGTFISPNTVLTASHCAQTDGQYTVHSSFGVFATTSRIPFGSGSIDDPNDIALLVFSSNVANPSLNQVMPVGSQVFSGDVVTITGFGCDNIYSQGGTGREREGQNTVYSVSNFVDFLTPLANVGARGIGGPNNRSFSCPGDSGGPASVKRADGIAHIIAVCHSGGEVGANELSRYVDLTQSQNHNFLVSQNQSRRLNILGL